MVQYVADWVAPFRSSSPQIPPYYPFSPLCTRELGAIIINNVLMLSPETNQTHADSTRRQENPRSHALHFVHRAGKKKQVSIIIFILLSYLGNLSTARNLII